MNDRELLQQALDALDVATTPLARDRQEVLQAQSAIRTRLAQINFDPDWDAMAVMVEEQQRMAKRIEELEGQLAQPEQEPLTDEQIDAVMPQPTEFGIVQPPWNGLDITILRAMARAIEAAHGITGEKK